MKHLFFLCFFIAHLSFAMDFDPLVLEQEVLQILGDGSQDYVVPTEFSSSLPGLESKITPDRPSLEEVMDWCLEDLDTRNNIVCQSSWVQKKGKLKKDQWWLYCEENQSNYLKLAFFVVKDGLRIPLTLFVDRENQLLFPGDGDYFYLKNPNKRYDGQLLPPPEKFSKENLVLELNLVAFSYAKELNQNMIPALESKNEFSINTLTCTTSVNLKHKRNNQYFHIFFTLYYRDKNNILRLLKDGRTTPFKLHNPRWGALKKQLSPYTAEEVLFMNLIHDHGPDNWRAYLLECAVDETRVQHLIRASGEIKFQDFK